MNNHSKRRATASLLLKHPLGGQLEVPGQGDANHILVSPEHHLSGAPAMNDKVLAWPSDAPTFFKQKPATRGPNKTDYAIQSISTIGEVAWESAAVVHELRQPLSAIVSNAEASLRWLAIETPNLTAARESAKNIIRDARAAVDRMEKLMNLFRGVSPQRVNVDLNAVILEVLGRLSNRIDESGIDPETNAVTGPICVYADRVQLEQVVHNLIANAIDAMEDTPPADRCLFIYSSREPDGTILVTVEDKGCGLDNFDRIFDPFFSTKATGLGMGLWICRSIIQSHDGKLWAEKAWHGGTRFNFTVPVH